MAPNHLLEYRKKVEKALADARRLEKLLGGAEALQQSEVAAQLRQELDVVTRRLAKDELTISVVAAFSAGKSHFLNALVFGDNVLESTAGETTYKQFSIQYGDAPALQYDDLRTGELVNEVLTHDSLKERIKALNLDSKPEKNGKPGGPNHFGRQVMIRYPNDFLKQGLTLIDTPGLGSMNQDVVRHHVIEALTKSDAVIFITDASRGADLSDFHTWTQTFNQIPESKRWVLMNKIDQWDAGDERDAEVGRSREHLVDALFGGKEPKNARIYPTSAREALRGRRDQDAVQFKASRLDAFEKDLFEALTRDRYRDFVEPEVRRVQHCEKALRAHLEAQLKEVGDRLTFLNGDAKEGLEAAQRIKATLDLLKRDGKTVVSKAKAIRPAVQSGFSGLTRDLVGDFDALLTKNLDSFGFWELFNAKNKITEILNKTSQEFEPLVEHRSAAFSQAVQPPFKSALDSYQALIRTCNKQLEKAGVTFTLDLDGLPDDPNVKVDSSAMDLDSDYNMLQDLISKVLAGAAMDAAVMAVLSFLARNLGVEIAKQILARFALAGVPVIGVALGILGFAWSAGTAPGEVRKSVREKALPIVNDQITKSIKEAQDKFVPVVAKLEALIGDHMVTAEAKLKDALAMAQGETSEITATIKQLTARRKQLDELRNQLRQAQPA